MFVVWCDPGVLGFVFAFARRSAKPSCRPPGSHPQLVLEVSSAEVMSLWGTDSWLMFVVWRDAAVLGFVCSERMNLIWTD